MTMPPKEATSSPTAGGGAAGRRPLGPRVESLEVKVGTLHLRVDHLEEVAGVKRSPRPEAVPLAPVARCPGCNLRIEKPKEDRCVWCGFVFSAAGPRSRKR